MQCGWEPGRPYLVDPLPKQISKAFADFLYGEDTKRTIENEAEQEHLDQIDEENHLTTGFRRAVRMSSSEGEAWWKIHVNQMIAQVPLLSWLSRLDVVPLFYGDRLLACAFVTEIAHETVNGEDPEASQAKVWRHFEVHAEGIVRNVLFCGSEDTVGALVGLEDQTATASLPEEWAHGLPMLAGRVVNDIDEDAYLGESDYDQVEDYFYALNEALTISTENARLTGKDRVFAAGRILQEDGGFNSGVEVFRQESEGGTLGEGEAPIVAIEKHYDSQSLWFHIVKLTTVALARVGIVAQLVGEESDGNGADSSGVAIRLRFLPTINASEGKGSEYDAAEPQIIHRMMLLSALPASTTEGVPGGFGKPYKGDKIPSVERADALPADETELVNRTAVAVTSEIKSRRQAICDQHPDWTDEQVNAELALIRQDIAAPSAELPDDDDIDVDPHDA